MTAPGITIHLISATDPRYARVVQLRDEVLRIPLGRSIKNDDLSKDATALIFIAVKEEQIIGCVLLQPLSKDIIKLRAMAVAAAFQGMGIGRQLVETAERSAREAGFRTIELHARLYAAPFYDALGYTRTGDLFTEVTLPHIKMYKHGL